MYIDKAIKKEFIILIISVLTLLALIVGISYSLFFSIDEEETNIIKTGDLSISFCNDTSCNNTYENIGQVIGITTKDGISYPNNVYPYITDNEALLTEPYIFNIKNTGTLDAIIKVKLLEDTNVSLSNDYLSYNIADEEYKNHLKIGISKCNSNIDRTNVTILKYSLLNNNEIISNEILNISEDNTYCLWTYLDETTPNSIQNTYFIASLDIEAEYKPKN